MSTTITAEANRAYRDLVVALARGEERPLAELLTVCAAVGRTVADLADDVDAQAGP